jgi:excisionase family DNA binding protein
MEGKMSAANGKLSLETNWLSLQEASHLLGVHPSTLRQWADSGKIPTVRTPGGHRRFAEPDVRALLEPEPLQPAGVQLLVQSTLGKVHMEIETGRMASQAWYQRFNEEGKNEWREMGRRLLNLVVKYLTQSDQRQVVLEEGRALGRFYGAHNKARGLSLTEEVQAFLFFQDILVEGVLQMSDAVGAKGHIDLLSTYFQIINFQNQVLLAMLEAYN